MSTSTVIHTPGHRQLLQVGLMALIELLWHCNERVLVAIDMPVGHWVSWWI